MMVHDPTPAAWWWSREREAGRFEKLVVVPARLTEAQKAKLQRIGVQRLREWLDRVRETSA